MAGLVDSIDALLLHIFKLRYRCSQDTSFTRSGRRAALRKSCPRMPSAPKPKSIPRPTVRLALPAWTFRLSRLAARRAA
jgi:hypothetical protein